MTILYYIVLPLATILISIVLEKLLDNPFLVAIFAFAIFLILAFTAYTTDFLINAIIYTILAFITAVITKIIKCMLQRMGCGCTFECSEDNNTAENSNPIIELQNEIESFDSRINSMENNINNLLTNLSNNNISLCNNRRKWY